MSKVVRGLLAVCISVSLWPGQELRGHSYTAEAHADREDILCGAERQS